MPLTETRLRALKAKDKPYKVADQRGLHVEVTPAGSKLWRFRYRIGKIEKKLSIGSYPDVSLKEARDATYEARQAVVLGGDPALEKRKRKIREEFLTAQTLETVAREYIDQIMIQNGRAEATIIKANYFLDQLVPAIGNRPINDIEPFEVLAPLKRLEATGKHETAKKCRSFAGRVFRYGVATTRCKPDPTSMLKGALVTPRATHYAAILDPQMQAAHARAAFICVWDDHETTNDSWIGGAENHQPDTEGDWAGRKAVAMQAYFEWMPIRDPDPLRAREAIFRSFEFGDLATLAMVETRLLARDCQVAPKGDIPPQEAVAALLAERDQPEPELLGPGQSEWLEGVLSGSVQAGKPWQMLGNQVVMARVPGPDLESMMGAEQIAALRNGMPAQYREQIDRAMAGYRAGMPFNLDAWDG